MFGVAPGIIAVIVIGIAVFLAITIVWGIRAHRLQVAAGKEDLVGKMAVVKEALAPKGVVFVEGERWTAILEKGRGEPEEEVIITRVDGLKLWVIKQ